MTKSIETMWKQGFINEPHLTAPKINNLYNRKSQNMVDKLQHMFAINIKAIVVGSIIMLLMMSLIGAPWLGLYICVLLAPLVMIAKKELNKSYRLSKGQSSYDYLINFDHWLQSSIANYARYYKVFYPMFFIGMATQAIISNAGGKLISLLVQTLPTNIMLFGLPYYLVLALICLLLVITKYAEAFYRWDLNLIYGQQFKKLKELITDMEELRNEPQ
ncbi:hypothetical protein tinsulaeT_21830 [Thalassotalea insulae]|uniref:Uncharacterized protein n=1 Tax=Thalassotalea insulae TaxID=2056778 RepID=A0ABQ6GSB6_9GAMM|nr:hypothetical protein [Thalassotalea insulae]GLX78843.1 hypothetical protein tinsulaeT_21830 [Thalassotalea insulae]